MPMKHKAVIDQIKRRLREEIQEINRDAAAAAYEIALTVEGYAVLDTPKDTGTLANGYTISVEENPEGGAHAVLGNTAEYAHWVHEMPGTLKGQPREHFGKTREGVAFGGGTEKGCYWDPDARPKFLELALEEHRSEYMDIARKYLER